MYEAMTSKFSKKFWGIFLSLLLAFTMGGGYLFGSNSAYGAVNVGTNPTPKVDIAVALPSDYPGTFLDFKKELTEKLVAQGMDPSTFRITDTATKIDTTNTDGWYVYDHYRDSAAYDALDLSAQQKLKQPFRQSDSISGTAYTMEYAVKNNLYGTSCINTDKHIFADTDAEGKTSMVFAGYPSTGFADYMIYPAPSDARRTFSFDINPAVINTHTLDAYGFFINAGISGSNLSGYVLNFTNANVPSLRKVSVDANSSNWGTAVGTQIASIQSLNFGPKNTVRLTVELTKSYVTVQYQQYDANMNPSDPVTILNRQPLDDTGFNGFGPYVSYSGHGCNALSMMRFLDLEMSYDSSAFDALKTTQYYEQAQQKYFINLAGDSNDPQIPDETDETFADGINRMNENEIFYLSNAQDGKIVRDSITDADGTVHQGLGANNGYIAMGDDYVTDMAEYIYTSYIENKKFEPAPVSSDIPLANFYIKDVATGNQLMTIHQQHLVNTKGEVQVNFVDKSIPGQLAYADGADDATIAQWNFKVYDPENNEVYASGWQTDKSNIENFKFTKDSAHGKWIFELIVKDQKGNESKASQTYVVAFKDNEFPYIEGANSGRNEATITLTDTGQGIDDDGITFIEDGRGSGVAAYWVTNDPNANPTDTDWEHLDEPTHQYSFVQEIEDTQPIVVWVMDECGNIGNQAVFQPTRVIVQDIDGNPIDNYIVIDEKPIIVLPDEKDLDKPEDEDDQFAGWTTPGGDPVTPGTNVEPNDNHTIIIQPSYSKAYATLTYLANGGTIKTNAGTATHVDYQVVSGNAIIKKIDDHNVTPTREGYSFDGWKLVEGDTNEVVDGLVNREAGTSSASGGQLSDPSAKAASVVLKNPDGNPLDPDNVKKSHYYLIAQWKIGDYTVNLDANGGSLHSDKKFEGVKYQANVGALNFPLQGRSIPTKPGYIFQGWSTTKNAPEDTKNTFKVAVGVSGITPITPPEISQMPSHDITVYAVWKEDKDQFVVHFDSDGGSRISDQAYKTATTTNYTAFKTPSRPGYDFDGWFYVKSDGSLDETAFVGTEAVKETKEHTFKAKWTPRTDTKYTVDYYVNSGNVDANGNVIYTKVNNLDDGSKASKTYTGATEATATVPEGDKIGEISTGSTSYWFNPESSRMVTAEDGTQSTVNNNVYEGVITGNPTLSLKLYYDRFFNVNVTKDKSSTGDGTCTSATKQKEGTTPSASWKAEQGSHVAKVIVNGTVRDDLINANFYTVEAPLSADVNVSVVFEKDPENTPGGNKPPVTEDTHFTINTRVDGTVMADAVILTPTQAVKNGNNTEVKWGLPENSHFTITKVTVDGSEIDPAAGKVDFTTVSSNHEVVVTVKGLPTMGGTDVTTPDKYTLTVNRYGGDDKVVTSKTMTVNEGEKAEPSWDATNSAWEVAKVVLDGIDITNTFNATTLQKCGAYRKGALNKGLDANHVLDIYMVLPETDEEGNPVDPVIPDYTDKDEFVTISTKLVGAEGPIKGSITGGAVVKKDSDKYDVNWTLNATAKNGGKDLLLDKLEAGTNGYFYATSADGSTINPDDVNYVCYELEKVVVNGTELEKSKDGKIEVPTTSDQNVEVHVKPVIHPVTIVKYGAGTVSPSKSVYHLGNYKNLRAEAADGWALAKIVVDGVTTYENTNLAYDNQAAGSAQAQAQAQATGKGAQTANKGESDNNAVDQSANKAADQKAQTEQNAKDTTAGNDSEQLPATSAEINEVEKAVTPDNTAAPVNNAAPQSEEVILDEETPSANPLDALLCMILPFEQAAPQEANADEIPGIPDLTGITNPRNVEVYFVKQATDEEGNLKTDPADPNKPIYEPIPENTYSISATIVKGEGSVDGNAIVKAGENSTITIKPNEGYEIDSVKDENGKTYTPAADGTITFDKIDADHKLLVSLKRTPVSKANDPLPGDIAVDLENTPQITTSVQGGVGTISGAGLVANGKNHTVSWEPGTGEKVSYVFIDGVSRPDLVDKTEYTFEDVRENHNVTVVFATNTNNVDTDGDGEPDLNIDTDGDGDPDVNKDTDGDGEPDVNIDTTGDGTPDVNKDIDGDGVPDVNIVDTDGDGKPDPVDPKDPDPENKKPNVNIDTDGDDEPDVNVDTDGNGKPDVNIDTDGDGKPDVNKDTDGDGKPDQNVVIDSETGEPVTDFPVYTFPADPEDPKYWPTVNVDTDGDGKPDVNIDVDGDGTPDINIVDEDKNGKADPIDPRNPQKPTINVDTDGDGWPDENINRDYGSKKFWEDYDATFNGDLNNPSPDDPKKDDPKKDKNSKKSKSSKTGDMTAPIAGGIALIALLSGLVLVLARRRKEN